MSDQLPVQCVGIKEQVDDLNAQLEFLQEELGNAAPVDKPRIIREIGVKESEIEKAEEDLETCIINNSGPTTKQPPPATIPAFSNDLTLQIVKKTISWNILQKKFDEFFNRRIDPPLFKLRFHHHDFIPPGQFSPDNNPPASDVTISMIEADVVNGQVSTEYNPISVIDVGQLDNGYYFNDINSSSINISLSPWLPEPIMIKINFECGGPEEVPSTDFLSPNMDIKEFYITLKLSFDLVRVAIAPPSECAGIKSDLDDLNTQLELLQEELQNASPTDKPRIIQQIGSKELAIQKAEDDLANCIETFGGADPYGFGKLDFLSWIDKIRNLRDDDFDNALPNYVVAHIVTTSAIDPGGFFQQKLRNKIYASLSDPATRAKLNNVISRWVLGGNGLYDVTSLANDGQNITINYLVPKGKLDPFPDSMFRPQGWPYLNNPNPDPSIDFSLPSNLSNIKHIVVLTMENRSFDHMLGYLSLPQSAGGMGRTDVDGLKGGEFNFYNGINYPSFPLDPGDTAFAPDPSHSYGPVFHQINADVDMAGDGMPGTGKMNGFVKSYAIDARGGDGSRIMGYHTALNVPVYDALTRDFGISHRWFAAHPGPTFSNRFYELTGRLNLASGLNNDTFPIPENTWEFSNSSPLTPVFNKTIFDHLTDYHDHIEKAFTWKYYENGYCFLRFFSKYTFDDTNIVSMNDPLRGFFADAKNGTLPSVSFIDPHYIELPPNADCDGPVADIKAGQLLVRKVVDAVVTSPRFSNTLLIITYDEHGGFYDHVPPPEAVRFSDESPIKTYGVRVPAFFISPWIKAGSVFGHDASAGGQPLYFDHTSILKTIARRFMTKDPPYMGPRYAAANDLTSVLSQTWRRFQFLPFVRYNLTYIPSEMRMNVEGGSPTSPITGRFNTNETDDQRFSLEERGDLTYIRTQSGKYLTVDVPDGNTTLPPQGFGIRQDVKYDGGKALIDPKKFDVKYQLWKLAPLDKTEAGKKQFIITNAFFRTLVLRPSSLVDNAAPIILGNKITSYPNAWYLSGPIVSS